MLNTQPSIIYFAQVDKEITFIFENTGVNVTTVYFSEEQYAIEPTVIFTIKRNTLAGESVIAYANEIDIIHSVVDNGITITPPQILVPAINIGSLQIRKEKVELMFQYLASLIGTSTFTTANYQTFNATFRDNITYYERGLDLLQAAIDASTAGYLTGANVQRKTNLKNILN
jgi:hypothetical protein